MAVGTAFATYNLARWALEFTGAAKGLDDQMTKLWKTFLGVADGQAEAGAKADVLARATKNAKRPITDYTEAIEINRKAAAAAGAAVRPDRQRDARDATSPSPAGSASSAKSARRATWKPSTRTSSST